MTEAFLQYAWQHQLMGRSMATVDGLPVEVLRVGDLNRDAGPDFFNARLRIDGVEWVGNVELHLRTSDWKAHRHSDDRSYNNVVLHAVYEHDCEIRLQNGKVPATVQLRDFLHPSLVANYEALVSPPESDAVPCGRRVAAVPEFVRCQWLNRLAVERIEAKSAVVRRLLDESHGGWEQTCYWLMAHYFGGKVNAVAFELLAKSTDQRLLARWKDNPQRLEALLMGQAGLLEGYFEDAYPRQLQADYEAIRSGAQLTPIDGYLWKFFCLRPSSFPTVRVSQFASLVSQSSNLFSSLLEISDVKQMERLFMQQASPYWDNHYQFDRPQPRSCAKRLGRAQAQNLIINAWVPLLFVYGVAHGQQQYRERALDLLQQLPPEDNAVVRDWAAVGVAPANAAESQALLQLKANYCDSRRCLQCSLGYNILKQR